MNYIYTILLLVFILLPNLMLAFEKPVIAMDNTYPTNEVNSNESVVKSIERPIINNNLSKEEPSSTSASLDYDTEEVIRFIKSQVGVPYLYGGFTPSGFDCSGLIYYTYKHFNITLPRTVDALYKDKKLKKFYFSTLQPGDLIFFSIKYIRGANNIIDHVGMYLGEGKMIHAPRTGKTVEIIDFKSSDYWLDRYMGSRRVS